MDICFILFVNQLRGILVVRITFWLKLMLKELLHFAIVFTFRVRHDVALPDHRRPIPERSSTGSQAFRWFAS